MTPERRADLDRDAGGDDAEECAVCYLQILLADELSGFGRERMLARHGCLGLHVPPGSARAWFERDASDAREWLRCRGLIDDGGRPTFRVRG